MSSLTVTVSATSMSAIHIAASVIIRIYQIRYLILVS